MTNDFMALGDLLKPLMLDEQACHVCGGHGGESKNDVQTCDRCHGQGYVKCRTKNDSWP